MLAANEAGIHRDIGHGQIELFIASDEMGRIHTMETDVDGSLYIGAERGLFHCDENGHLVRLSNEARVFSILSWDSDHLFFGTGFSGLHLLYAGLAIPYGMEEGLPFGPSSAVEISEGGFLWVGTFSGEVFRVRVTERVPELVGRWETTNDEPIGSVRVIESLDDSTALVGTSKGLYLISISGIHVIENAPVRSIVGQSMSAFVLFEDSTLRRYAREALTSPHGAHRESVLVPTRALGGFTEPRSTASDYHVLYAAPDDTLYVAGEQLARVRPGEAEIDVLPFEHVGPIQSILSDQDGTLWVGTAYGGLYRSNSGDTHRLTIREGLHDDTFFTLLHAPDNDALIGASNRGIVVYRRAELDRAFATGRLRYNVSIDVRDGMRSRECNGSASRREGSAEIWFPTARGVVVIRDLTRRSDSPSITLEGFLSMDGEVESVEEPIRLSPNHDGLIIELGVSPLVFAPWAHYEYSISSPSGRDAEFVDLGDENRIRFLRPGPGDYSIRVRAIGRDGVPGPTSRIQVRVDPHLYESAAVRVSVLLSLLAAMALGVRARIRVVKNRQNELERIVAERTMELRARSKNLVDALERLASLQADLLRAERLTATAMMVRGVAHELRNPVNVIAGNIGVLARYSHYLLRSLRGLRERSSLSESEIRALLRYSAKKNFEDIERDLPALLIDVEEGLRRTKLILSDLGDLDRGIEARTIERTSIDRAISSSIRFLEGRSPAMPEIVIDCPSGASIDTYAGVVEQLVTNLLSNAIDATRDLPTCERAPISVVVRTNGDSVSIAVIDCAEGMSPEVMSRATEPFFTTKPPGQGSGLGLAISMALVRSSKGTLELKSEPGQGTVAKVVLPSLSVDSRHSREIQGES